MKINWTVRAKNPVFWYNIALAIFVPMLTYFGLEWKDMTTWPAIWNLFVQAISNPVVVLAQLTAIWNAIGDPTTKGISDSERALTYESPSK